MLEKTTNISFITLVCIFSPHPYIEIAINPICSGNITHFIYLGDTLLSTCWFFHTISQRCRKLCVLGCFSQLRDRGKKSGALGTAVMILTPKETKSTTVHKNQYTPQLQSQILHVMEVLLQQIASCRQTGCYTAHTRDTSRNSCLSRDSERKKKKIHTHSSSTPPQQRSDSPQSRGITPPKAVCFVPQQETFQTHAQSSSLATAAKQHVEQLRQQALLDKFPTARAIKGSLLSTAVPPGKQRARWHAALTGHQQHPACSSCTVEGCWAQPNSPLTLSQPGSCR